MMTNTTVQSVLIQVFLGLDPESQLKFLSDIRELCDTLEKSQASNPDDLSNLTSGDVDD